MKVSLCHLSDLLFHSYYIIYKYSFFNIIKCTKIWNALEVHIQFN